MQTKSAAVKISDSIGSVSTEIFEPSDIHTIITLAHGAGAGMNHRFMKALAHALAEYGIGTLRFNFPFIENGKKMPDFPAVAEKTIEVMLAHAKAIYGSLPLFASGKSFGGRMSSQHLSKKSAADVKGIIFYGFPLHPAGKPSVERATHLEQVKCPMLFLQGTRDTLAKWDLIEGVCSKLPTATLEKIEGADHGFLVGKKECIALLAEKTNAWIKKQSA